MSHICPQESVRLLTSRGRIQSQQGPEHLKHWLQLRNISFIPHSCPAWSKLLSWRLLRPHVFRQHVIHVWWESVGSLQKPRCHHQISGLNAKLRSYRHFPCLFCGHWYLMNPYRVHTELVHMPCYHTGPFPGAPTGRASSRGTGKKVTQLPFGKEGKRTVGTSRIRLVRNFNFCCGWSSPGRFE